MARLPDAARSRAVLIGTGAYADPELPALPAVHNNLADLRAVLTGKSGCLAANHCTVLADPRDDAEVGDHLTRAAGEAEDLLLVYYAGHGLTWTSRRELYLSLRDTRLGSVGTSALRCAEVRQAFLDSAARTRVLILDCCFSGRAFEQAMADPAGTLLNQVDVTGAYILTATQPNQLATAPAGDRNTLFTGELLRLLRNGVPDGPELLTLDVLYRELKASLRRRNLPEPSCSNSDAAAHLALARNAAHRPAAEVSLPQQRIRQLRAAVGELAVAEAETARLYETVRDKIFEPALPALSAYAQEIAGQLVGLDQSAVVRLARETAEALEGTRSRHAIAKGLLDRREELRGRLTVLNAMAVRLDRAENADCAALFKQAHEQLWTKPCDLEAATRAVLAYQRCVTDGRDG